ncbi:MAG: MerR family transcriptional regulator [Bacteroidales bacterium]|nr:MerR family transcriptional regulator [Bacteroidales bacterium]
MAGERSEYPKKQFYSISEVAEIVGTNESTLRFWEREFKEIKPRRASRGVRLYSNSDLEVVKLIYHLVKEKGLTLDGAKKRLKDNPDLENTTIEVVNRLKDVRAELMAIRNYIEFLEAKENETLSKKASKKMEKEEPQTYSTVEEEPIIAEEPKIDDLLEEDIEIENIKEDDEDGSVPTILSLF